MLDHFLVQPTPIQSQLDDFLYPPAIIYNFVHTKFLSVDSKQW